MHFSNLFSFNLKDGASFRLLIWLMVFASVTSLPMLYPIVGNGMYIALLELTPIRSSAENILLDNESGVACFCCMGGEVAYFAILSILKFHFFYNSNLFSSSFC